MKNDNIFKVIQLLLLLLLLLLFSFEKWRFEAMFCMATKNDLKLISCDHTFLIIILYKKLKHWTNTFLEDIYYPVCRKL